jgi:hypothetical protein
MFEWVSMVELGFSGLCFEWVSMVELGFSGLCFEWVSSLVYVLVDYFDAFQAEMWVDLTWSLHSDLCELNTIYSKTIVYALEIIVSCF